MDHELIKQVIMDQQLEIAKELNDYKFIERDPDPAILHLQKTKLIKVITGVRRSGKSSLAVRIGAGSFFYLNFDDERFLDLTAKHLNDVLETFLELDPKVKTYVFDEIQNVPGWELFLNRLKRRDLELLVTGSNGKLLSKELATHLTGRHYSCELFPFSFREYLVMEFNANSAHCQ